MTALFVGNSNYRAKSPQRLSARRCPLTISPTPICMPRKGSRKPRSGQSPIIRLCLQPYHNYPGA